jgi:uncharacterized protein (TIGR01777 family)
LVPKRVLITGGSGLIGSHLTHHLLQEGVQVVHLGRSKRNHVVPAYQWDVEAGEMDVRALGGVDSIVHLAGAGVADKRWTPQRKQEILQSRVQSTALLFSTLKTHFHQVKTFVSASAIGYYGFGNGNQIFDETSGPGNDFLSGVVVAWEKEVDALSALGIRLVKIRIGIVLSAKGGALKEMIRPIRWGMGAPLGSGEQFMSWIHIDDLCRIFTFALLRDELHGVFNATAGWVTNREFTKKVAGILHRPLWLPSVPAPVLRMLLGEMADMVLNGSKVSSEKIKKAGFSFKFENLSDALQDLLKK